MWRTSAPNASNHPFKVIAMRYVSLDSKKDELLLAGRVLMMILFVLFGWQKLNGF